MTTQPDAFAVCEPVFVISERGLASAKAMVDSWDSLTAEQQARIGDLARTIRQECKAG